MARFRTPPIRPHRVPDPPGRIGCIEVQGSGMPRCNAIGLSRRSPSPGRRFDTIRPPRRWLGGGITQRHGSGCRVKGLWPARHWQGHGSYTVGLYGIQFDHPTPDSPGLNDPSGTERATQRYMIIHHPKMRNRFERRGCGGGGWVRAMSPQSGSWTVGRLAATPDQGPGQARYGGAAREWGHFNPCAPVYGPASGAYFPKGSIRRSQRKSRINFAA
jgi:hypothetical protein